VYRQWFKDNPGKKREYRLKYQEYEREYQRTYRAATADHIRERNAEWRAAHPEYGKNWREANPERTYEYQRRGGPKRRAAKLKLPTESIAPAEIFERDGWRCQLCGERVQKTKKYPDIMSPSLDHIVPLSLGGHHVRANVQLAHLFCNISKRERAKGEQLRLIG
jgi:5-methylcytosine-specific restriction endonuclease McrA